MKEHISGITGRCSSRVLAVEEEEFMRLLEVLGSGVRRSASE